VTESYKEVVEVKFLVCNKNQRLRGSEFLLFQTHQFQGSESRKHYNIFSYTPFCNVSAQIPAFNHLFQRRLRRCRSMVLTLVSGFLMPGFPCASVASF